LNQLDNDILKLSKSNYERLDRFVSICSKVKKKCCYYNLNDIGKTTATEELSQLVIKGFYKPTGKSRGAKYGLN
jgi:hypothetical protein